MVHDNIFKESMFFNEEVDFPSNVQIVPGSRSYIATDSLSGQIIGAATDKEYHRFLLRKIYDKLAYGCKMSDIVNSVIVRCQEGLVDRDVQVLIYGRINGGVTAIRTGGDMIAIGKFDEKNRFIARRIEINNSDIEIKTELIDILVYTFPIILLLMGLFIPLMGAVLSSSAGMASVLIVPLIGGAVGTMHLLKKTRFFIPFRYRLKAGLVGGIVLSIIMVIVFH